MITAFGSGTVQFAMYVNTITGFLPYQLFMDFFFFNFNMRCSVLEISAKKDFCLLFIIMEPWQGIWDAKNTGTVNMQKHKNKLLLLLF